MVTKKNMVIDLVVCLFLLGLTESLSGAEMQTCYFPLAIDADANMPVLTSLYLQIDTIVYNTPTLSEFTGNISSREELALRNVLEVAAVGDLVTFEKLLHFPKNVEGTANAVELAEILMPLLKDIEKVYFQLMLGNTAVFFVGDNTNRKNTLAFIKQEGEVLFDFGNPNILVDVLFRSLLAKESFLGEEIYTLDKPDCEYECLLTDPSQEHPAKLLFNGRNYQSDEYLLLKDRIDQVASMSSLRRIAFHCGHEEQYADMCTPLSGERLIKQLHKHQAGFYNLYPGWLKTPDHVYVIDASPYYIVVNQFKGSNEYELTDYLWDDKDNRVKQTNFSYEHSLKQLLHKDVFKDFLIHTARSK